MIVKEDKVLTLPKSYFDFLKDIKVRIKCSQIKTSVAVNQELITLHWWIGRKIVEKQNTEKWWSKILEKLCNDIQSSHPGLKGFSRSNIFNMRAFFNAYQKVQQVVGQL